MSDNDFNPVRLPQAATARPPAAPGAPSTAKTWQNGDTTSFSDVLDVVNPLQHIPIVSTIYRAVSGDEIGAMPRIIGGALFGGPIGLVLSLASSIIKGETGQDPGEMVMASLFGPGQSASPDEPLVAANTAPATQTAAAKADPAAAAAPSLPMQMAMAQTAMAQTARPLAGLAASPSSSGPPPPPPSARPLAGLAASPSSSSEPQPVTRALAGLAASPAPASPRAAPAAMQVAALAKGDPPSVPAGMPLSFNPDARGRFRSTALPSPSVDGGAKVKAATDLVPTADGHAIVRDEVPNAMTRALDKYAEMMRARNAQQTPTQVSVLR